MTKKKLHLSVEDGTEQVNGVLNKYTPQQQNDIVKSVLEGMTTKRVAAIRLAVARQNEANDVFNSFATVNPIITGLVKSKLNQL